MPNKMKEWSTAYNNSNVVNIIKNIKRIKGSSKFWTCHDLISRNQISFVNHVLHETYMQRSRGKNVFLGAL